MINHRPPDIALFGGVGEDGNGYTGDTGVLLFMHDLKNTLYVSKPEGDYVVFESGDKNISTLYFSYKFTANNQKLELTRLGKNTTDVYMRVQK